MRSAWLVLLLACSTRSPLASPAECPASQPGDDGDTLSGTPCALPDSQLCFVENEFSACESAWFRCVGGTWTMDHGLGAADGQSCAGAALASCDYEGNPGCTEPTSQSCSCGADGAWHCTCGCYGAEWECGACPADFPGVGTNDLPACSDVGSTCAYPGHTCTCTSDGRFSCT